MTDADRKFLEEMFKELSDIDDFGNEILERLFRIEAGKIKSPTDDDLDQFLSEKLTERATHRQSRPRHAGPQGLLVRRRSRGASRRSAG